MPNQDDRPKVGPADPETLSKKFREKMDEPTKATGVAPRAEAPAKPKKQLKKRFGAKGQTEDEILEGEDGGTMQDAINKGIKDADEDGK